MLLAHSSFWYSPPPQHSLVFVSGGLQGSLVWFSATKSSSEQLLNCSFSNHLLLSVIMSTIRKLALYTVGEIILLILIAIPTVVLQFTTPFQSGFFPNDTTIAYPQRPNTVSMVWAAFFGLGAPLLAIFIIEIYISYHDRFPRDSDTNIPVVIIQLYKLLGLVAFSFAAVLLIVQVGKESIGSLRPFFLEACKPSNNIGEAYQPVIICSADNARLIEEARMSFPSGHSSASAWGAAMTAFYLQIRFPKCPIPMLKAFFQISVAVIAYYICLTRIQDNWHRPIDVIVGSLLGVAAAAMIFLIPVAQTVRVKDSENSCSSQRFVVASRILPSASS
ncbi:phosphatidate phosphatase [Echinococcus multilocularis]|uniref:Phosphatidate phosphatase n=1 Tax=Echinococcus multilocularis TaxID=6211 RepID=A0A068Y1V3_ECHMU|nr:phosphatidate phosphatase [Echinococcus multilocularis]